ncbi:MAG: hypothetical protein ABFD98_16650 [Syntrophobacteraceae bacterium]|nr:flagellar protein FlgN [Desulfobacteraceae bacterium]
METLNLGAPHDPRACNSTGLAGNMPVLFSECIETAGNLSEILTQETAALRSFSGEDLLHLLPGKQILVNELQDRLETLRKAGLEKASLDPSSPRTQLRNLLRNIQEQNRANEVFIQNTLGFWQDMLSLFFRSSYGPGQGNAAVKRAFSKGRTFRTEV